MRGGGSIRAGGIYHIISRFTARDWFIESRVERRRYLSLLGAAIVATDWRCFAYAIMSSHIHLAFVAGAVPLADWMRPMHTDFANWINAKRERIGAVFVKGPNVIEFQAHGTAQLVNYIHQNPVRAGVTPAARDCDWTSHRAYAGLAEQPRWLDIDAGLMFSDFDRAQFCDWTEMNPARRDDLGACVVQRTKHRVLAGRKMRNPPEQEAGFCL